MVQEKMTDSLFGRLAGMQGEKTRKLILSGAAEPSFGFMTAALAAGSGAGACGVHLVVARDQDRAERLAYEIETLLKIASPSRRHGVYLFSSLEWSPYEFLSPSISLLADRVAALRAVMDSGRKTGRQIFIVAPIAGLMQKTCPTRFLDGSAILIKKGADLPLEKFVSNLVGLGYVMEDPVIDLGQYSLRGGILDIYAPGAKNPVRLDFFGDTVERIKIFNIEDQRTVSEIDEFEVIPASEYIFTSAEIDALFNNMNKIAKVGPGLDVNKLRSGLKIANVEKYAPFMYDYKMPSLIDYLESHAPGYTAVIAGGDDVAAEASDYYKKLEKLFEQTKSEDPYTLPPDRYFMEPEKLYRSIGAGRSSRLVDMTPYDVHESDGRGKATAAIASSRAEKFGGRFSQFVQRVRELLLTGGTVVMIIPTAGQISRMTEILSAQKFSVLVNDNIFSGPLARNTVYLNEGYLYEGFYVSDEKLFVFSSLEIYGEHQVLFNKELIFESKAKAQSRYKRIASHLELAEGDYVVHVNYGIGIYRGITLLSTGGYDADYLLIEYADSDKLYVPIDSLHMLHKYIGVDDSPPRVGRLSESSWKKQKSQAKRSIEQLATYLVSLYAKRSIVKGYRFSEDCDIQKQFEESFPYKETIDQENAIVEVKCDMESEKPMDRLVCGDVGFGKTEVAIRAAFKACMEGKQVAILAPTTILSMQHYNTLMSRYATYPIKVELLSRFRTKAEQKKVLERMASGDVDVVVGTHRIIQSDIKFKDLGLLVVDEEQRFGVKHKEKIKELRHQVDVLTLTATPIPRTLYMTMVGCRDISLINTPPAERLPIKTFVLRYSDEVVRDAVSREMMRKGQVYYVYNRIETIDQIARKIAMLVPGARVRSAHGQMDEKQLEKIMVDFNDREFDVLVATTIIENGLDIPNVNTIIIERADTFGLSQLYQLRGRVGRAKNQAYAYFLFPHEAVLSDIAKRRLQSMKEFSDLGSGYKIAMRDLEIRGAGNILGHEQHGHICTIGFELYCRLLEDEVKKVKGEAVTQDAEYDCEIDIEVNAYIPTTYINSTFQKIDIYKRMIEAQNFDELNDLSTELTDRFGKFPITVYNLFQVVKIKILGRRLLVTSVKEEKKHIIFRFKDGAQIDPQAVQVLISKFGKGVSFAESPAGTLMYLLKQDLKGDNLMQMIITALTILGKS